MLGGRFPLPLCYSQVEDPLRKKGWSSIQKRAAAISLSDRSNFASIVKNIKLSPDYDIISQLTAGLAANWAKLSTLFGHWDKNQSGTLSRKEMRRAVVELGLSPDSKAIDAMFDGMDVDKNGEVTLEEFTIAIRASLRVAKSAQLESLAQPTATQSARTRLPAVGAAYLTNVSPSTRNRVGRVSPRTARLDTVQERVLMRGTGATRYVGHSNGGAAAAVASVPPHTASRSNTPRVALRGATGAALGGSAVPTSTSPRSPRRTVEPPHAILPPVLRARPAPRKVAVEEEAEWYARVLNRSDVGQLLGQLNARDALLAERMSSAA